MERPSPATRFERPPQQQLRVGFVMLDRFTLNAFSGCIDALRLAADRGGRSRQLRCGWEIMGVGPVTASCGLQVALTAELQDPQRFDYIAVCGGNGFEEPTQPSWLTAYIRSAAEAGVGLIGVCTGTFNLARAGVMRGYPACVHWNTLDAFRAQFPEIEVHPGRIFLDAGGRVTGAGSAGAADMALHLIARHCGHAVAQQAARHMILHAIRPAEAPQPHFYNDLSHVRDERVRQAVTLMEQTLNEPLTVAALAMQVDAGPRQLERRFRAALGAGPAAFYRDMRLRYGAFLLRHTTDSVLRIALDAGFADGAHFARAFRQRFGYSPLEHRRAPPESAH